MSVSQGQVLNALDDLKLKENTVSLEVPPTSDIIYSMCLGCILC